MSFNHDTSIIIGVPTLRSSTHFQSQLSRASFSVEAEWVAEKCRFGHRRDRLRTRGTSHRRPSPLRRNPWLPMHAFSRAGEDCARERSRNGGNSVATSERLPSSPARSMASLRVSAIAGLGERGLGNGRAAHRSLAADRCRVRAGSEREATR